MKALKTYFLRNKKELIVRPTKSKARLIYEHKCPNCSNDFISNRLRAIYCSDNCRIIFFRKKKAMTEKITEIEIIKKKIARRPRLFSQR